MLDHEQIILDAAQGRGRQAADVARSVAHVGAERMQELIKQHKLTSRQLAALTPAASNANMLSLRQNLGILRDQAGDVLRGGPRAAISAIGQNMKSTLSGTAGLRGGTGPVARYMLGPGAGLALSALPTLYHAAAEEDPTGRGRGRYERVGQAAGSIIGSLAGTLPAHATARLGAASIPANMAASMLGGRLGGAVGGLIGKGIGKVAPKRKRKARSELA